MAQIPSGEKGANEPSARTLIFIPAYEAARTLEGVVRRIPDSVYQRVAEILIQDDASQDSTFCVASRLAEELSKVKVVRNSENLGYGSTKKKAYKYALDHEFDIVAMVHGDGQHAPEYLPKLLEPLYRGAADIVLGSRILGNALRGGMPIYKWLGNRLLTSVANLGLSINLTDYHTGYRAYTARALTIIDVGTCCDGHEISFEIICRAVKAHLTVAEVPVPTHYGADSRSISLSTSVRYGLYVVRQATAILKARLYGGFKR